MLTEGQANRIWQRMIEAEVRSLYFGELAARYTKYKQIITGASFLLSSGAAATIAAQAPQIAPIVMASLSAILMAYSISAGLDRKAGTMAKLHYVWNRLQADYERIWQRWYEDEAERDLESALTLAREASETGTLEAPYDETLLKKWQDRVYERYGAGAAA